MVVELTRQEWDIQGEGGMTPAQQRMLNMVCGDLARHISWHGQRLNKDDFRHLISGTILGWRMMPAIDRGEGAAGFIMLGGSSLNMSKTQASDAITQAILIGDDPGTQGLKANPVRWSDKVYLAMGFNPRDFE